MLIYLPRSIYFTSHCIITGNKLYLVQSDPEHHKLLTSLQELRRRVIIPLKRIQTNQLWIDKLLH